jgi:hypothetical protein
LWLTTQLFLGGPGWRQTAQRLVRLRCLSMVGGLGAGVRARQRRRGLAARPAPLHGLRPAGRATLTPTVPRRLRAWADYSLGLITRADGPLVRRAFAQPNPVHQPILEGLVRPHPEALCRELGQALPSSRGEGSAGAGERAGVHRWCLSASISLDHARPQNGAEPILGNQRPLKPPRRLDCGVGKL